jgi:hypothetical protein
MFIGRFFLLLAGILILSHSLPAFAAGCYTEAEAEAEQGIRIHSELMVIALNCEHMEKGAGKSLYSTYREFTDNNVDLISGYEKRLMSYFKRQGIKNPEAAINTLRTGFSNTASYNAASIRTDRFCSEYAPRVNMVSGMAEEEFRTWASTSYQSNPSSQPVCNN